MSNEQEQRIWIGLFAATGEPDNIHLQGCPGAYVTVLGRARNESIFRKRVTDQAGTIGLIIDEMVWSEPLSERLKRFEVEPYLHSLVVEAEKTGQIMFGIFHAWEG
jgi:hypothetical protein